MRTLIFGTSYIGDDGAQKYGARMVELWAKLAMKLNPEADILLIDSASKVDPMTVLRPLGFYHHGISAAEQVPLRRYLSFDGVQPTRVVASFPDNIGHLNVTGRDGWGRAFCEGVSASIQLGHDYVAHLDADMIFTLPVRPIFDKMARAGVQVCEAWDSTYAFGETSILFFRPEYMARTRFVERYDWPSRKNGSDVMCPERICDDLWKDELFTLPLRGLRDDFNRVTVNNLATGFPMGLDYLTHCRDFAVYERLLQIKGIEV